jgi:hypothetical protein
MNSNKIDTLLEQYKQAEINKGIAIHNAIVALNKANSLIENNFNLSEDK